MKNEKFPEAGAGGGELPGAYEAPAPYSYSCSEQELQTPSEAVPPGSGELLLLVKEKPKSGSSCPGGGELLLRTKEEKGAAGATTPQVN